MKTPILILLFISLICGCANHGSRNVGQPGVASTVESETYYGQLKSLLSRKNLKVRPKTSERDINLIEVEKGAAGMLFGATMDDIVAVWGKPSGFMIHDGRDIWDLNIGACRFGFIENALVSISVHNVTIPNAHFKNGINFESSIADVLSVFGEPIKATDYQYKFVNDNGYVTEFHFIPDSKNKGKQALINITISSPDAGK